MVAFFGSDFNDYCEKIRGIQKSFLDVDFLFVRIADLRGLRGFTRILRACVFSRALFLNRGLHQINGMNAI